MLGVHLEPCNDIVAQWLTAGFVDGLSISNQLLKLATILQSLLLDLVLLELVQIGGLLDLLHSVTLRVSSVMLYLDLPLVQFITEFSQIVSLLLGDH